MCSQIQQNSRAEVMRVLKVLDQALEPRTFLVGESITLADMAVAMAVLLPFKYVRNGVFALKRNFGAALSYICSSKTLMDRPVIALSNICLYRLWSHQTGNS